MKIRHFFMALVFTGTTTLFAQTDFMSSGQNKLLINPAFCASSEGLNFQELGGYGHSKTFNSNTYSNYAGLSYAAKRFGFSVSNSFQQYNYGDLFGGSNSYHYLISQTSVSAGYKIKLGSKTTLIPALQSTYYTFSNNFSPVGYQAKGLTFSTGAILDFDKRFTFGAAFYNFAHASIGASSSSDALPFTQVYHASALFFKDKKVTFQPYAIFKIESTLDDGSLEVGAYTSYKMFSLQTAYHIDGGFIAGLSAAISNIKFGYTFGPPNNNDYFSKTRHEVFISVNPFKKTKKIQRNLMMD